MRAPDLKGRWAAWKVSYPDDGTHTALAQWLLLCPHAHPMWSYYVMTLVHLREAPGINTPNLQYPEAEHELIVWALHPDATPDPDDHTTLLQRMDPLDQVHQFHGVGDDNAIEMVARLAGHIAGGVLSPDQDHRSKWRALIRQSVEHFTAQKVCAS